MFAGWDHSFLVIHGEKSGPVDFRTSDNSKQIMTLNVAKLAACAVFKDTDVVNQVNILFCMLYVIFCLCWIVDWVIFLTGVVPPYIPTAVTHVSQDQHGNQTKHSTSSVARGMNRDIFSYKNFI